MLYAASAAAMLAAPILLHLADLLARAVVAWQHRQPTHADTILQAIRDPC